MDRKKRIIKSKLKQSLHVFSFRSYEPKHVCIYHYLLFVSFHLLLRSSGALTGVSGVVDGSVCLDEDVPGMEGHHQYPLLRVQAVKVHRQIHKLVLRLLAIQTIRGQLAKRGQRVAALTDFFWAISLFPVSDSS